MLHPVQIPEQALIVQIDHPVTHNDDENMDSVQDLRADPVRTDPDQLNKIYPVQVEQVLVVQDPDGFCDCQDPGNVEAPRAIRPVLNTYPTNQVNLIQINHHVQVKKNQVERAGQVLMVSVAEARFSSLMLPIVNVNLRTNLLTTNVATYSTCHASSD
jgi:hypothetical protein